MKYEITDAHADQAYRIFFTHPGIDTAAALTAVLEDFVSSIPDPLPTLRPIAEMPAEVPEGCVRFFCYRLSDGSWLLLGGDKCEEDTHFIDIPVESAEDKMRAEFEAWYKTEYPQSNLRVEEGEYNGIRPEAFWNVWKAAKSITTQP